MQTYRYAIAIDFGTSRSGCAVAWLPTDSRSTSDVDIQVPPGYPGGTGADPKVTTMLSIIPKSGVSGVITSNDCESIIWGEPAFADYQQAMKQHINANSPKPYFLRGVDLKAAILQDADRFSENKRPLTIVNESSFDAVSFVAYLMRELYMIGYAALKGSGTLDKSKIKVVVTIPPRWGLQGASFWLRKAAEEAAIVDKNDSGDSFTILSESEAAALYAQVEHDAMGMRLNRLSEGAVESFGRKAINGHSLKQN